MEYTIKEKSEKAFTPVEVKLVFVEFDELAKFYKLIGESTDGTLGEVYEKLGIMYSDLYNNY